MAKQIDISKLSKAEREAREKRLAYNRKYDAAKKAGKVVEKKKAHVKTVTQRKTVVVRAAKESASQNDSKIDKIASIHAKLTEVNAEMNALYAELVDALKA